MVRDQCRIFLFMFILLLFLGLACNFGGNTVKPDEEEPVFILEVPENMEDEPVPYPSTVPPRDESKIILMEVEPTVEGNLAKVTMFLPEHLKDSEIYANDIQVDAIPAGNDASIDLVGKVSAKEIAFSFQSDGEILATCKIMMDGLLTPEGDCNW